MNSSQSILTQKLTQARISQKLSQRELAKRAGTTQAVISRIENEEVNPSIGLLERLGKALGQNLLISTTPTIDKLKHKLVGEYHTLNNIHINSNALTHNYHFFKQENPQAQIAPVLKANAYGHGLVPVGEWIEKNLSVPFVCLDSLFEAYKLRNAGINLPLLIMGYTHPKNYQVFTRFSGMHITVFDFQTLQALTKYQPHAKIHLKIDTGMHRLGILPPEIPTWIKYLKKNPQSHIVGIMSHLSSADSDTKYTNHQILDFKQAINKFESAGFSFIYKHIAATAGSFHIKDPEFNLVRLGLGFYGYSPFPDTRSDLAPIQGQTLKKSLLPALTLTTKIAQIKRVGEGSRISYNGIHITTKPTIIGILPIGYSDGLSRELSNQGYAYVDTEACPIIGNITMNQTIIDLTNTKRARVGDSAEIISPLHEQKNSILSLTQLQHTIPYTILTSLNPTIKRKIT